MILPRMHGDVAIEMMGRRGRKDKDDAGSGGSGLTTPFVLERTDCHMSSSLSGARRTLTLEVLLCTS